MFKVFFPRERKGVAGFSIPELLVVLALGAVMTTIVVSSFGSSRDRKFLETDARNVLSIVEMARSQTLTSKNGTVYGVYFASTSVTLFTGSSYVQGAAGNLVTLLDSPVIVSNVAFAGGGQSVVFNRLTGETSKSGTVTISLVSNPERLRTITISPTGLAELDVQ